MRLRHQAAGAMAAWALFAGTAAVAAPPVEWDGMQRVSSKRFDHVYLVPGADFRSYTKVIVEPTEVAFHKNWRREQNQSTRSLGARVSERDVENAVSKGVAASSDIFVKAWREGGYAIVNSPGPDTLKVRTGIVNISVAAPDLPTAGRTYSFSNDAGHATLVVELRDSLTGALLGRAVDTDVAGDNTVGWRSSVSNQSDFRQLVENWARDSVRGMSELKRLSGAR